MRYLLDTSALLAHHRQETGWEIVQAAFEDRDAEVLVASVTLTEFSRRLFELGAPDEVVWQVLADYEMTVSAVISVDAGIAKAAVEVTRQTPQRLPLVDALIAATARICDALLLHRDGHMAVIPGAMVRQQDLSVSGIAPPNVN
jgi:predicted nucleic acid-binding protein